MTFKPFYFLVFLLMFDMMAFSQGSLIVPPHGPLLNFVPAPPNAAALGKFGDIPVSYYTGIPNISIPIYSYADKSNGLNLSVSLDYHAGGIRVEEKASDVGIGWALDAGGVITREIRGLPDDKLGAGYWSSALPTNPDPSSYSTTADGSNPYFAINAGQLDGEPDIFTFNFNGRTGKFVVGKNGQAYIWPQQQLKIEKFTVSAGQEISFAVTTEDGTRYVFDKQESTQLFQSDQMSMYFIGSAWYLSKIISPFSTGEINLTYQPVNFLYLVNSAECYYKATLSSARLAIPSSNSLNDQEYRSYKGQILSNITYPNNIQMNFYYASIGRCDLGTAALKKIEITDGKNIKGFKLGQDYSFGTFSGATETPCTGIDPNTARLVLHQVTEYSGAFQKPPYVIEYNISSSLPSYRSYAQDHWGFFNNANNQNLLPYNGIADFANYTPNSGPDNADRRTNPTYSQAGIIKKIIYPTGGSTTFTFESNDKPADIVSYVNQAALASINGFDPNKSTYFTLINASSVNSTTFQFDFAGFSAANSSCSITASITNADESSSFGSVILGPGTGYTKSVTLNIPAGQYKFKYVFSGTCVQELFVVSLHWTDRVPPSQNAKNYIGGLRIKKIEESAEQSGVPIKTREYSYVKADNITSSGSVAINPTYNYTFSESCGLGDCTDENNQCVNTNASYTVITSSSLFTLANSLGSPVLYSRVEEKFTGDGTGNNGRVVRNYSSTGNTGFLLPYVANNPNFYTLPYITPETPEWIYGLLASDSTFDNNNNLKHTTSNVYATLSSVLDNTAIENYKGVKVAVVNKVYLKNSLTQCIMALQNAQMVTNAYYPYSGRSDLMTTIETTVGDNGTAVQKITEYNYDNTYFAITKMRTTDSKGVTYEQRVYYPYNNTAAISSEMLANHIYSPVITNELWKLGSNGVSDQLISSEVSEYAKFNGTIIKPLNSYYLNTDHPLDVSLIGVFQPNSLVRNTTYLKQEVQKANYDGKGHVLQQLDRSGIIESYMWGYNEAVPVAKITNASNTLVKSYTAFTNTGSITVPASTNATASTTINTYYPGNVVLTISFSGPPSANAVGRVSYTLGNSTGVLCVTSGASSLCSGYSSTITFTSLPAGSYALGIVTNVNSNTAPGSTVIVTYSFRDRQQVSTGIQEFFYESFEENTAAITSNKYAGNKSYSGPYQVPYIIPNARNYYIDYHYFNGSKWVYIQKSYVNNMTLSDGSLIDEVRVYPVDAGIITYTYEPLFGVSSVADLNGRTTFYEYDGFGRLQDIKDMDGKVLKLYDYEYQQ